MAGKVAKGGWHPLRVLGFRAHETVHGKDAGDAFRHSQLCREGFVGEIGENWAVRIRLGQRCLNPGTVATCFRPLSCFPAVAI